MVAAKPWNDFVSPMSREVEDSTLYYDQDGEFEAPVAIGSKLFPECPIRSHREAYYQLQKKTQQCSQAQGTVSIRMVIGIGCEKVLEAGFTGLNTRSTGDSMVVKFTYAPNVLSGRAVNPNYRIADHMHIVMHADHILKQIMMLESEYLINIFSFSNNKKAGLYILLMVIYRTNN